MTPFGARRGAFTLIELLVVIAIIALLVSILLPSLQHVRSQGQATVCLANLRSLGLALQTYLQTNGDRFPSYGYVHGGESAPERSWINLLAPEYGRRGGEVSGEGAAAQLRREVRDIRRCPADRSPYFKQAREEGSGGTRRWRQTSYASNFYLVATDPLQIYKDNLFDRLDRIPRPERTICWVELAETGEYATADHIHPERWIFQDWRRAAGEQVMLTRHDGRANYGLVDGHAEPFVFEKTFAVDLAHSQPPEISWFYNKYDPDVAR